MSSLASFMCLRPHYMVSFSVLTFFQVSLQSWPSSPRCAPSPGPSKGQYTRPKHRTQPSITQSSSASFPTLTALLQQQHLSCFCCVFKQPVLTAAGIQVSQRKEGCGSCLLHEWNDHREWSTESDPQRAFTLIIRVSFSRAEIHFYQMAKNNSNMQTVDRLIAFYKE